MRSKNLKLYTVFSLILLFTLQFFGSLNDTSAFYRGIVETRKKEAEIHAQELFREGLKIVIACPDEIDENDSLSVYVAGFRNARATYVYPKSVSIVLAASKSELLEGIQPKTEEQTDATLTGDDYILANHSGYESPDGTWKVDRESTAVNRLSNKILFNTRFKPLQQELLVKVVVTVQWIAPWHEMLTTTQQRYVGVGAWRNFTKLLETDYDKIRSERIENVSAQTNLAANFSLPLQYDMESIQTFMDRFEEMKRLGGLDPSDFHIYLLNISSIIDPDTSSGSYLGNLGNVGSPLYDATTYAYHTSLLAVINQAFLDSVQFLIKKLGSDKVIITHVNTTYDLPLNEPKSNAISYNPSTGFRDADWDNEHLVDASFEFLLEGAAWTGHSSLIHAPHRIFYSSLSASQVIDTDSSLINQYSQSLQYLEIYDGYVYLYNNSAKDQPLSITVNEAADSITVNEPAVNATLEIYPKGGFQKTNRSIIVNLMGEFFPMINRLWTIPRGLNDPVPATDFNEYYVEVDNESYIPPPVQYCQFYDDSGQITNDVIEQDITSQQRMNFDDIFLRYAQFTFGQPFFINPVTKPFSILVYDDGAEYDTIYDDTTFDVYGSSHKDHYNALYTADDYFFYLNRTTGEIDPTINLYNYNITFSFFNLFDAVMHITSDMGGGSINPKPVRDYDYFYKNNWGRWIDAFFNGTIITGDMVQGYPSAWTFRYIDKSILLGSEATGLAAEYQLAPFQGPSDYAPIGIMTVGAMSYIQNSMLNLTAGFVYSYGLIYNVYRRIFDGTRDMYIRMQQVMANENRTEALTVLGSEIRRLEAAWDDLDMKTINDISMQSLDFLANPSSVTAIDGVAQLQFLLNRAISNAEKMRDSNTIMKEEGARFDNEVSAVDGTDIQKLALAAEIGDWLNKTIFPTLLALNSSIQTFFLSTIPNLIRNTEGDITTWITNASRNFNSSTDSMVKYVAGLGTKASDAIKKAGNTISNKWIAFSAIIGGALGAITLGIFVSHVANAHVVAAVMWAALIGGVVGLGIGAIVGFSTKDIGKAFTDAGEAIGSAIENVVSKVSDGLSAVQKGVANAMFAVGNALKTVTSTLSSTFQRLSTVFAQVFRVLINNAITILKTMQTVLKVIASVLDQIKEVLTVVIDTIAQVFDTIASVLTQVADTVKNIIGKTFELVVDITGNVFNTLKTAFERIKLRQAFTTIGTRILNAFASTIRAFGFLDYVFGNVTSTSNNTQSKEELLFQMAQGLRGLAKITAADRGFYVYQLGSEFADKLYYIVTYNGEPVAIPDHEMVVEQYVNSSAFFDDPTLGTSYDIVKAPIPLQPLMNENNETETGIYYIEFSEDMPDKLTWYKNITDSDSDRTEAKPTRGYYMTFLNATIETPEYITESNPLGRISSFWAEVTYLYGMEYTQDGFFNMTLVNALEGDMVYTAGGNDIQLLIDIQNEMWSRPYVQISVTLSSDKGTPISQSIYPYVQINAESEGVTRVSPIWSLSRYTPGGNHTLIVSITEANGDVTTIAHPISIIQPDQFSTFFYNALTNGTLFIILGIVAAAIIGFYVWQRKRIKSGQFFVSKITPKTLVSKGSLLCSIAEAEQGLCELDGDKWCTPKDLGKGTCKLPTKTKWSCDPVTKRCKPQ